MVQYLIPVERGELVIVFWSFPGMEMIRIRFATVTKGEKVTVLFYAFVHLESLRSMRFAVLLENLGSGIGLANFFCWGI